VANGVVYIADDVALLAWDASGTTGCSGAPRTCEPLLIANSPGSSRLNGDPAVVNGHVYVASGANVLAYGIPS
jgi:hypothetical protein